MHVMAPNAIIDTSNPYTRGRIYSIIKRKQDGRCHFCDIEFTSDDSIVSCGHGRSYYHESCAKRLHII
ncbi:MAG: hypothetical protein WB975_15140, partial [Nitrososphaeraceae archaeon]